MANTKPKILFIGAGALLLLAVIAFVFTSPASKKKRRLQSTVYSFTKLDKNVAAEVSYSFDSQAPQKKAVLFAEILNAHYKSLLQRKQEVTFLEIHDQFLKSHKKGAVTIQLAQPERPLKDICQIYGRQCGDLSFVKFNTQQKDMLEGAARASWSELKTESVPYLASETEILNYLLNQIHESLRNQLLNELTKLRKKNTLAIIAEEIISDADLKSRTQTHIPERATPAQVQYQAQIERNRAIDEYLMKNVLKGAIAVNIERPSFDFPIKWEWTPYFGSGANGKKVVLFADFLSDASREMISILLKKRAESPEERYGFRPFFLPGDRFQVMAAEMSMCVWAHESNSFWDFLGRAMQVKRDSMEQDFYDIFKDMKLNEDKLKKCFLARDTKQAVEYHQTTAAQLKIINAPVIFVGDEVVVGPLSSADLEKMLAR